MTERWIIEEDEPLRILDSKGEYESVDVLYSEDAPRVRDLLNKLNDENEQIKQELDYIQNSITEHIKHQKTELGQKALKEVIKDYNEAMLGHKGDEK